MRIFNDVAAVIFDHDGTLVDSEPVHLLCWQQTLAPFAKTLSAQQYAQHLSGFPSIASAGWIVNAMNLDVTPEALLTDKQARLDRYLDEQACPIIGDVKLLLHELWTRNIPMAIASGASRSEVTRSLEYHQIGHYFRAAVTKDDVENNKPAPDVYLGAAKILGVDASRCVAIEDSDNGQTAALAAGMHCIRLNTPTQLQSSSRCALVANFHALLNS